jgi:SAM-dependent methyltransferase
MGPSSVEPQWTTPASRGFNQGAGMAFRIGVDFDRAIDWGARLGQELPFLRAWLQSWNARRAADLGCGTGRHAAALAAEGFEILALDTDPEMLAEARRLCTGAAVTLQCHDMRRPLPESDLDAVFCLGNSLALLPGEAEVLETLRAMHEGLRPRGGFIVHLLNYERFRDPRRAFFPLRTVLDEQGRPLRHYLKQIELHREHAWVHLISIGEDESGQWRREVRSDRLLPLRVEDLLPLLREAGFVEMEVFGNLKGESWLRRESHDLVVCGRRG